MTNLYWLSDEAWAAIEPELPKNQPGARRVDDRRVISGIVHVLRSGCRWRDCPAAYGPYTTVYNRFNRWSRRLIWQRLFKRLAVAGCLPESAALDATYVKAHRSAAGGKGGREARRSVSLGGGRTTKVHLVTDLLGRPVAIHLTAGNVADVRAAPYASGEGRLVCVCDDLGEAAEGALDSRRRLRWLVGWRSSRGRSGGVAGARPRSASLWRRATSRARVSHGLRDAMGWRRAAFMCGAGSMAGPGTRHRLKRRA